MTDERITDQPRPTPNQDPAIADLVIADIAERRRIGTERYGTPLQAHNGRAAFIDLYQELLDAVQYARQIIEETPESEAWAILYEDPDHGNEVFFGAGAEEAARKRFANARLTWNCTLFRQYAPLGWERPDQRDEPPKPAHDPTCTDPLHEHSYTTVEWMDASRAPVVDALKAVEFVHGICPACSSIEPIHRAECSTYKVLRAVVQSRATGVGWTDREPAHLRLPVRDPDPDLAYAPDGTVLGRITAWHGHTPVIGPIDAEPAYKPIPLDLTDPRLAYLLDPTADVDEDVVVWERIYREKDGRLDGCTRCQNGLHWQCHGCSCPCSGGDMELSKYSDDTEKRRAWVAAVRAIGPYHLNDPVERALIDGPA